MDAAALALNIDSSSVVKAANDLDRFSASSTKAASAASKLNFGNQSGSIAKLVASVQSMDSKLSTIISSLEKMGSTQSQAAASAQKLAAANDNAGSALAVADSHVVAYTQHLAGLAKAQQNANAHVVAFQAHVASAGNAAGQANAHVQAYQAQIAALPVAAGKAAAGINQVTGSAQAAGTAIKFTAREGLNASRQLADIGVTAASGMSPFLIALQQGPQLFDILQEKAVATGSTIGATFRAAGAAVWAAIAPLLPIILPIVVAVGLLVAGIAALTKQANDDSGLKKYTTAMGYTKAEVEKLNAVTVTFGDTAKAVFQVGWERIASAFGLSTEGMAKTWKSFLDWLATATRATLAGIYAGILGTLDLKDTIVKDGMNGDLGWDTFTKGYKKRYAEAQKFMDDVVKQAGKNARKRQDDMATKFYDAPKGSKSDPLGDILLAAEAEIKAEQARAAAVGLSARAATELEQKTKLLNQIEKAKIPVTDGLRLKVAGLAKAYADAKIAADTAMAIEGVSDGIAKQVDAVNDATSLIGLYGDALIRATNEVDALRKAQEALPKGEKVSSTDATRIAGDAKKLSDDQILQNQLKRAEDLRKASEDAAYAMDLERKGLGLTGEAAIAYAYVVERLNAEKQKGVDLSPTEVAAIEAAGAAYAKQRYAIDQTAKAMSDAREIGKGFFTDWFDKVRDGANVFKSFADSVVSSLNRIIDKMLDRTLDKFFDGLQSPGGGGGGGIMGLITSLFGGGGGGSATAGLSSLGSLLAGGFATGGVFDRAHRFAKGGAFTNTIVNTPTLFRFANGGAIGEMGEAGPEAVMPLKRGPNGSLGVEVHGGGKGQAPDIYISNNYEFAGAVGIDGIVSMIRQGGEATYNQVKRDLQTLLRQLDNDGSFAS